MSKNNVNKDHYEHAHGRERQGEEIVQYLQRQKFREQRKKTQEEFEEQQSPAPPEKR